MFRRGNSIPIMAAAGKQYIYEDEHPRSFPKTLVVAIQKLPQDIDGGAASYSSVFVSYFSGSKRPKNPNQTRTEDGVCREETGEEERRGEERTKV